MLGGFQWTQNGQSSSPRSAPRLIIVDMQAEGCERHGPGLKPVIQNIQLFVGPFSPGQRQDHPRSIGPGEGSSRIHFLWQALLAYRQQPRRGVCRRIETRIRARSSSKNTPMTVSIKRPWKIAKEFDLRPCRDHWSLRESARTIVFITRLSAFTFATTSSTSRKIVSMPAGPRASSSL